jgi:hypothetical protein
MGDHAKEHSDGLYGEIRSYALERIEGEFSCVTDGVIAGTRNDLIYVLSLSAVSFCFGQTTGERG